MYDLIIIGLGPAGISASLYAANSNLKVLAIEYYIPGGYLNSIDKIDNYLGYTDLNGPDLAFKFYKQFKSLNIPMINEEVKDIQKEDDNFIVKTNSNEYKSLGVIIATGRGPLKLGIDNDEILGISYCVLCDGSLYKGKDVAIYGNKPQVLEDAIYLSNIVNKVYLIVNEDRLLASPDLKDKVNNIENIEVIYNQKIMQIIGDKHLAGIKLINQELNIDGLFVNNGFGPKTKFLNNLSITDDKGYININQNQETSIPGLFACGDCTKKEIYQVVTSASEGAVSAINVGKYIQHKK